MEETAAARVAASVRAEMARRRVTQSDVAKALGMKQTAVSRRLTGQVPFDVNELTAVAAFLGVPVAALLGAHAVVGAA